MLGKCDRGWGKCEKNARNCWGKEEIGGKIKCIMLEQLTGVHFSQEQLT